MPFGEIYLITNLVNGHRYIGQTRTTTSARWRSHLSAARGEPSCIIDKAIKKHGAKSFKVEIIDTADDNLLLNRLEEEWISVLDTAVPNGYNVLTTTSDRSYSADTREKLSRSLAGRELSDEHRAGIRLGHLNSDKASEKYRLSEHQVRKIFNDIRPQKNIALEYAVSQGLISAIQRQKIYRWVTAGMIPVLGRKKNTAPVRTVRRKFTDAQALNIFRDPRLISIIGKEYGVSTTCISNIKQKKTYTDLSIEKLSLTKAASSEGK